METEEQELDDHSTSYRPRQARQLQSHSSLRLHCCRSFFSYTKILNIYKGTTEGRDSRMELNSHKRELLSTELVQHPRKTERGDPKKREGKIRTEGRKRRNTGRVDIFIPE